MDCGWTDSAQPPRWSVPSHVPTFGLNITHPPTPWHEARLPIAGQQRRPTRVRPSLQDLRRAMTKVCLRISIPACRSGIQGKTAPRQPNSHPWRRPRANARHQGPSRKRMPLIPFMKKAKTPVPKGRGWGPLSCSAYCGPISGRRPDNGVPPATTRGCRYASRRASRGGSRPRCIASGRASSGSSCPGPSAKPT